MLCWLCGKDKSQPGKIPSSDSYKTSLVQGPLSLVPKCWLPWNKCFSLILTCMLMVTLNSSGISVSSLLHHIRKALFKFVLYLKASRRKGLAPLRQKHPFLCQKAHCKTEGLNQKGLLWKLNTDRERRLIGLRYLVAKEAFSWLGGNSPGCSAASCGPSMLCFLSCFLSWKRKEQKAILGMKSCVKQMAALS